MIVLRQSFKFWWDHSCIFLCETHQIKDFFGVLIRKLRYYAHYFIKLLSMFMTQKKITIFFLSDVLSD